MSWPENNIKRFEEINLACDQCGDRLDHDGPKFYPGTSDMVVEVVPCSECYIHVGSPEMGHALEKAREEGAEEASKDILNRLMVVSRKMSTNDWDVTPNCTQELNLRKILDSDGELSALLYLFDKEEQRVKNGSGS